MIEVNGISKYYGSTRAVDNISFQVNKGEIVGFLGPNGAGKTTTMRMLTGYLYPDQGNIKIANYDIIEEAVQAKRHIGYLPENAPLYLDMSVKDYFDFVADIKGVSKSNKKDRINEIIQKVGLNQYQNKIIGKLSKGYKQRVGIGEALIGDPDILILDEPTIGLDPNQIIEIRNLIKELGKEKTIILSSHILQEVSALCSRIIIINEGRLVAVDTKEELMKDIEAGQKIKILVDHDFDQDKNTFWHNRRVMVTGGNGFLGKNVVRKLQERGADIHIVEIDRYDLRNLDDIRRALNDSKPQMVIHLAARVGGIGAHLCLSPQNRSRQFTGLAAAGAA